MRFVVGMVLFVCMLAVQVQRPASTFETGKSVATQVAAAEIRAEAPLPTAEISEQGGDELYLVDRVVPDAGAPESVAAAWWLAAELLSVSVAVAVPPPIA